MSTIQYKAAMYLRKSYSDDKSAESDSVSNQRKIIESYIAAQPDMELVGEWVDDGVTGLVFDRPSFLAMMEAVEHGEINCIVVKDLSRFGREYTETMRYMRRILPAYGVRLIALGDGIDMLKDSGDDLVISVKTVLNDSYCRDISVKTRSSLRVKRKSGDYVGACPVYGYRKDPDDHNHLVVDEYPAQIVRDIFRMKLEGISALKISEELNRLGILSPSEYKKDRGLPHPKGGYADKAGAQWSATTIIRILNDETYTGTLVQGRQGTPNYKLKEVMARPEEAWVRTENAHEAIISPQDFDLAQRIMRLDTRSAPGNGAVYLFSGILICNCCGARMTRKTVPYKGKKYHYYYCPTTKKRGCKKAATLKEDELTDCILENVKAHVVNVASLDEIISSSDSHKAAQALAKQYSIEIEDNERQLEKIGDIKRSLYENLVSGLIDQKEYKTLKSKFSADEDRKREAIEALTVKLEDILAGKEERLRWMESFRQFKDLQELDRRTIISLIQSIRVISKTELQITFHYQDEYEKVLRIIGEGAAA